MVESVESVLCLLVLLFFFCLGFLGEWGPGIDTELLMDRQALREVDVFYNSDRDTQKAAFIGVFREAFMNKGPCCLENNLNECVSVWEAGRSGRDRAGRLMFIWLRS